MARVHWGPARAWRAPTTCPADRSLAADPDAVDMTGGDAANSDGRDGVGRKKGVTAKWWGGPSPRLMTKLAASRIPLSPHLRIRAVHAEKGTLVHILRDPTCERCGRYAVPAPSDVLMGPGPADAIVVAGRVPVAGLSRPVSGRE